MPLYEVAVAVRGGKPTVTSTVASLEEARVFLASEIQKSFDNDPECADLFFYKEQAILACATADVGGIISLGKWIHGLRLKNGGANG